MLGQRLEPGQTGAQVGTPDVAAIDHADRQHRIVGQHGQPGIELLRRPHQVDVEALHRQLAGQFGVVGSRIEIGGQQQLDASLSQLGIGGRERSQPGGIQIQAQHGLVDLHPLHPLLGQAAQHAHIAVHQTRQQGQTVHAGSTPVAARQPQEADRTRDHHLHLVTQRLGLGHLVKQPVHPTIEAAARVQLRHQVVVVGVEPLGHFHGRLCRVATRQLEVLGQAQRAGIQREARGQGAQGGAPVEHLVIPGEIAHRDDIQTSVVLDLPVALTQRGSGCPEGRFGLLAAPEGFLSKLQFTLCPDAGKAKDVCAGHVQPPSSCCSERWAVWPAATHESSDEFSIRHE